ncbi:hypothetical protein Dimus_011257, partial [Dionaea muscipula]
MRDVRLLDVLLQDEERRRADKELAKLQDKTPDGCLSYPAEGEQSIGFLDAKIEAVKQRIEIVKGGLGNLGPSGILSTMVNANHCAPWGAVIGDEVWWDMDLPEPW